MSTKSLELNERSYGRLLGRTLARVIHSDEEYERLSAELLRLDESERLSEEEEQLAELLTVLVDEYEGRRYPIRKASPRQTLLHLMEARRLAQKDLWRRRPPSSIPPRTLRRFYPPRSCEGIIKRSASQNLRRSSNRVRRLTNTTRTIRYCRKPGSMCTEGGEQEPEWFFLKGSYEGPLSPVLVLYRSPFAPLQNSLSCVFPIARSTLDVPAGLELPSRGLGFEKEH